MLQVGKHLGNVQNALPMRLVCHEWRDTITLGAREAEMDLAPDSPDETSTAAKRSHFFKSCPLLKSLTYHVSPKVSLAKVNLRAMLFNPTLCSAILECCMHATFSIQVDDHVGCNVVAFFLLCCLSAVPGMHLPSMAC